MLLHTFAIALLPSSSTSKISKMYSATRSHRTKRHSDSWSSHTSKEIIQNIFMMMSSILSPSSSPRPLIPKECCKLRWQTSTLSTSHLFKHTCENVISVKVLEWILTLCLIGSDEVIFVSVFVVNGSFIIITETCIRLR